MIFTHRQIAEGLEAHIRQNKLLTPPVPWADELIFPQYDGLSIMNVIHTVADLFNAPLPESTPLDSAVWGDEAPPEDIQRVIVIISDGLGYHWLRHFMAEDEVLANSVAALTEGRGPVPLTSTSPSTTATALTTFWTGAPPAQHGMIGFRFYLREIAMLAIPLFFSPGVGGIQRDRLIAEYKLDPETFVPVRSLAEHLAAAGVPTVTLLRSDYYNSGIGRILHRRVPDETRWVHRSHFDKWLRLRDLLAETRGQRCYVNIYFPAVDDTSHYYGASAPEVGYTIQRQLGELREVLANESLHDGHTLVLFTADHGQSDTPNMVRLKEEPEAAPIFDALRGFSGGEARMNYWYLRDGLGEQVREALVTRYADRLVGFDPAEALAAGLYGSGPVYAEVPHRLGDKIVYARQGWAINDGTELPPLISHHGALSEQEMLVPLLWRRI